MNPVGATDGATNTTPSSSRSTRVHKSMRSWSTIVARNSGPNCSYAPRHDAAWTRPMASASSRVARRTHPPDPVTLRSAALRLTSIEETVGHVDDYRIVICRRDEAHGHERPRLEHEEIRRRVRFDRDDPSAIDVVLIDD